MIDLNLSTDIESSACNKIGQQGAEQLAVLLKSQKFLAYVNLKGNSIGNNGFKALSDMLPMNDTLLSLNVERNQITGPAIAYLTKVI